MGKDIVLEQVVGTAGLAEWAEVDDVGNVGQRTYPCPSEERERETLTFKLIIYRNSLRNLQL